MIVYIFYHFPTKQQKLVVVHENQIKNIPAVVFCMICVSLFMNWNVSSINNNKFKGRQLGFLHNLDIVQPKNHSYVRMRVVKVKNLKTILLSHTYVVMYRDSKR